MARTSTRYGRARAASTLHRIRATLRVALNTAMRRARYLELPLDDQRRWSGSRHAWRTGDHPTVAVWTAHQSAQFLHYIRQRRLYSLFRLITLVGLRRGEACALRWCDLDLQRRAVLICWQLQQHSGELSTCEAKTASSVRLIALDRLAVTALRRHYATTARSVTRLDTLTRHRSGALSTKSRALVPPNTAGLTGLPGPWNGDDANGSESAPGTVATCSAGWTTVITETMVQITRRMVDEGQKPGGIASELWVCSAWSR